MLRRSVLLLIFVFCAMHFTLAQTAKLTAKQQAEIVASAQKMAVRSVTFRQGDLHSLNDSSSNFTPEAWKDFLNHMSGFLDDEGASTFTSSFVPSGKATVIEQKNGTVHFRIPGALTQTHDETSTNYRHAALDVTAGGQPIKIQHLEQIFMLH